MQHSLAYIQSDINTSQYTPDNYFLYEYNTSNKKFYTLVNKTQHQIEKIIDGKGNIVDGFEAGKIHARWNSKNQKDFFVPNIGLWKKNVQDRISKIIGDYERQKSKIQLPEILNQNIADGIYQYTNSKSEVFEVGILGGRVSNISAKNGTKVSGAQKAAITRCIKSYIPGNKNSRLQSCVENINDYGNTINHIFGELDENKIQDLLFQISQENLSHINKLKYAGALFKEYKIFCTFSDEEQKQQLQSNMSGLLFQNILSHLKIYFGEQSDEYIIHQSRIKLLAKIISNMYLIKS